MRSPCSPETSSSAASRAGTNGRARCRPSACQMEYARSLAGLRGLDGEELDGLLGYLAEKPLGGLSGGEASGLIRAWQEMRGKAAWGRTPSIRAVAR